MPHHAWNDLQDIMPTWLRTALGWLASAVGLGSIMGFVNVAVGILSAAWIATQLWRFWRYDVHALRAAAALRQQQHQPQLPPTQVTPHRPTTSTTTTAP